MFCCDSSKKKKKNPLPKNQGLITPQQLPSYKDPNNTKNPYQIDDNKKKKSETDSIQQSTQQIIDTSLTLKQVKSFSQSRASEDESEEIQKIALQIKVQRTKISNQNEFRRSVEHEKTFIEYLIKEQIPDENYLENDWAIEYTQYLSKPIKQMRCIDNTTLLQNQRTVNRHSTILINNENKGIILRANIQDGTDYVILNRKTWCFLTTLYGGGPEIRLELQKTRIFSPKLGSTEQSQKKNLTPEKQQTKDLNLNRIQMKGRQSLRHYSTRQNDGTKSYLNSRDKIEKLEEFYLGITNLQSLIKPPTNQVQQAIEEQQEIEVYSHISQMECYEIPVVGLKNPKLYCYMNSALQCLMTIPQLNSYFLTDKNRKVKIPKQKRYTTAYTEFLKMVNSTKGRNIEVVSSSIIQVLVGSNFSQQEQQDSHEFLLQFLSQLQDELVNDSVRPEFESSDQAWKHYCSTHDDIIDQIFAGQITSSLTCKNCQFISEAYDPILDLSLPIPKKLFSRDFSLFECLKQYFSDEEIIDVWKCGKCNKKNSKVKRQINITKTPNILIIQFKRFSVFPKRQKIQNGVQYPDLIDLQTFCSKDVEDTKFKLKSMIIHDGSINGGHYMAIGKRKDNVGLYSLFYFSQWYFFDDQFVEKIYNTNLLKQNDAYVLFYEKI